MHRRVFLFLVLFGFTLGGITGCGGYGPKGIHQDKDQPKPAENESPEEE